MPSNAPIGDAAGSARRGCPCFGAASAGLGVGKADQLVADDLVREPERTLDVVERAAVRLDQRVHRVETLGLVLDLIGEAAFAPPVGLADDLTASGGDPPGDLSVLRLG